MATEFYILKASNLYFLVFHCQSTFIQVIVKAAPYRLTSKETYTDKR